MKKLIIAVQIGIWCTWMLVGLSLTHAVPPSDVITSMDMKPDDTAVALGNHNGELIVYDVSSGTYDNIYTFTNGNIIQVMWHPTNNQIAVLLHNSYIAVIDSVTSTVIFDADYNQFGDEVFPTAIDMDYSSDGSAIAIAFSEGAASLVIISSADGSLVNTLPNEGNIFGVDWKPNTNSVVAYGGGEAITWDLNTNIVETTWIANNIRAAWSADGTKYAYNDAGDIIITDSTLSPIIATIEVNALLRKIEWSPSGTYLGMVGLEFLEVWDWQNNQSVFRVDYQTSNFRSFTWFHSRDELVYLDDDGLTILDVSLEPTATPTPTPTNTPTATRTPSE